MEYTKGRMGKCRCGSPLPVTKDNEIPFEFCSPKCKLEAAAPYLLEALKKSEQRIVQLVGIVNSLSHKLCLGQKANVEDWADIVSDAISNAG
jgi:hypothetical protein